ncbi:unnamed protein product [Caenorhabditis angaria]|uniref:Acyl_transf_3 domain-containing protein n=1 Tax=Caenorhabditis angaria TaxID=860376 RepID=A0A9P1N1F8_9PELO|nr:unnamed protein product [Caenorhabditis angaria]
MSEKRLDLQGIRGLAILAVLGFHFYPELFPNGYLGVDQFFVLSGFLMCMLLTKSQNLPTPEFFTNFYTRRFKRTLPLYQLCIFFSLIFLITIFPEAAISQNEKSAKKAMLFISNRLKSDQENYFEMLSIAIDIFTHTWSLSVEIQFYFLAPIIFLLPEHLYTFSLISVGSFIYFHHLPTNFAFLSVFARIWQFMTGMLAFTLDRNWNTAYQQLSLQQEDCECLLQDEEESLEETPIFQKSSLNLLTKIITTILLFSIFYFEILPELLMRPIVTFLTGILLLISSGEDAVLSNKVLVYLGDISYSLYLIHWPIVAYWKMTGEGNQNELAMYLMLTVGMGIVMFHTFETWYTGKASNWTVFVVVVLLSLGNLAVLNRDELIFESQVYTRDGILANMTLADAIRFNKDWSVHDDDNLLHPTCDYEFTKPLGWCNQTGLSPRNKYRIMIIGNSWAANQGQLIYDECKDKAKIILQGSAYGCEPFYPSKNDTKCKKNFTYFEERVREFEPDYAFHLTRHISYGEEFSGNYQTDQVYQTMLKQMKIMTKYIKRKFFILDAIPWIVEGQVRKITDYIKKNVSFVEIDKKYTNFTNFVFARERYAQLFKDCGNKCERIDYIEEFYRNDTGTYRFFDDRGFSYMTSANHLSPHGLEKIRHVFTEICDKL